VKVVDDPAATYAVSHDPADVYLELAPAVLGYLRGRGVDDPENLLGEVFLQVVRDIPRFRGDDRALRRWVFSIAHNRLVDHHRRGLRRPVANREPPDRPGGLDPAARAAALDTELLDALLTLTPAQRDVVVLRFIADLPTGDVARITRRRPGAVRALQLRGLCRLRELLTP
jgi:RNA polymerase sigma-70 factor (ECF subfamily)